MWRRYRFQTLSNDDYRPLIFNPKYPWWCSGRNNIGVIIIAFLPEDEDLFKYWDDATNVEYEDCEKITFSNRFQKPYWFEE